ncbi:MAG: hypothetical protein L6306_16730 [Planctomycetales bacterium]|nr:hypothetical protein [Planctomycetales bacterium]
MDEFTACTPDTLNPQGFNKKVVLPCGLTTVHIRKAMAEFLDFLGFLNQQLNTRQLQRMESFLMPANFSSMVGEFMSATIPKYCKTLVKNTYHNGHPDLLPARKYEGNACQHGTEGIEIKASRHGSGWQGHNAEDTWLMVFVFDVNSARDASQGIEPKPFRFLKVVGGQLVKSDWAFSGRSATSRRTITASVKRTGFEKLEANWIYRAESE